MAVRPSAPSYEAPPPVIIPRLNRDPVWSLRIWPVVLAVGRREVVIPAASAADWLQYLLPEPADVDGLIGDLAPELEHLVMDEVIGVEEMYQLILDAIETVSARHWWVTMRLIRVATQSWDKIGALTADAAAVSLAKWLDTVVIAIYQNIKPEDATMFTMQLEAPPVEEVARVQEEDEGMSAAAFLAMG